MPVYVIGHRNPDTDSICAAIGYADYLRRSLTLKMPTPWPNSSELTPLGDRPRLGALAGTPRAENMLALR
jgi:hypothetical protein